ncbi:MAG TPA: sugar ABC transporter permease [Geminicoccaceae bacterium]|nr:sugar ABC transporter permease [Geminicoccaceae bacterium]
MREAAIGPEAGGSGAAIADSFDADKRRFYRFCIWPLALILIVITLVPMIYLVAISFTPLNLTQPQTFGDFSQPIRNYQFLTEDGRFHNSLWVQAKLSLWSVGLQLLFGFLLALFLNLRSSFLETLRTVFLIPMVLPPIVVAVIWKMMYTPAISPFHWSAAALGFEIPSLIASPDWALTAIIVAEIWQGFPFTMLMVLAALQMMPEEYIEAARIDGANVWQTTLHVTLPFLKGVLLAAGLFRLIDSMKAFPLIYLLTEGGPGEVTEVTNYYSFTLAFNFSFLGYSSAITVILMAMTIVLTWAIVKIVRRGEALV